MTCTSPQDLNLQPQELPEIPPTSTSRPGNQVPSASRPGKLTLRTGVGSSARTSSTPPPPQPPARLFGSYTQTQSEKLSSALGKRNKGRSIPLPASEGKVQSQHLACAPHHQHFMKKRHEAVSHATCSEVRREVGEWFPGAPLRTGGRVIHGGKGSEYQSQCDPYPEILHLRSRLCSPTVG